MNNIIYVFETALVESIVAVLLPVSAIVFDCLLHIGALKTFCYVCQMPANSMKCIIK